MILVLFFQGYYGKYPFNSEYIKEVKKDDVTLPSSLSSFSNFFHIFFNLDFHALAKRLYC